MDFYWCKFKLRNRLRYWDSGRFRKQAHKNKHTKTTKTTAKTTTDMGYATHTKSQVNVVDLVVKFRFWWTSDFSHVVLFDIGAVKFKFSIISDLSYRICLTIRRDWFTQIHVRFWLNLDWVVRRLLYRLIGSLAMSSPLLIIQSFDLQCQLMCTSSQTKYLTHIYAYAIFPNTHHFDPINQTAGALKCVVIIEFRSVMKGVLHGGFPC